MGRIKLSFLKPHIIFWSVFIFYEVILTYYLGGRFSSFWDYAGHYVLYIALFYFNAHVVFSSSVNDNRRNYFLLVVFIICELVLYVLLKTGLYTLFHIFNVLIIPDDYSDHKHFLLNAMWRGIYFIFLSTGYWFALTTIRNREKIADLENLKLKNELDKQVLEKSLLFTENAYLKSQINPHFLLNTLNFLYNSVSKLSEDIAESVLLLSDIMRYALTNADEDGKVQLELEIENIINFIKLNQARFNQRLNIDMQVVGDIENLRIIPLVLITFTENVFKYGDLLNDIYPVKISATIDNNTLIFITQNAKRKRVQHYGSHGIGIENVKNRLAMYYQYELIIEDSETEYKSTLIVEL
jgi:two-component system LytT family sensor kinase